MGQLEIVINADTNDSQVEGFVRALKAYAGTTPSVQSETKQPEKQEDVKEEKPAKAEKPKKTRKSKTTKASESKKAEEKPAEEPQNEKSEKPSVTIEEIRAEQKKYVSSHRDEIVAKLRDDLGAKNVSTLKEKDYDEYFEFLKGLGDGK